MISKLNMDEIEQLKKVIEAEEGHEVSSDQTLTRVLRFYKKYVPYN